MEISTASNYEGLKDLLEIPLGSARNLGPIPRAYIILGAWLELTKGGVNPTAIKELMLNLGYRSSDIEASKQIGANWLAPTDYTNRRWWRMSKAAMNLFDEWKAKLDGFHLEGYAGFDRILTALYPVFYPPEARIGASMKPPDRARFQRLGDTVWLHFDLGERDRLGAFVSRLPEVRSIVVTYANHHDSDMVRGDPIIRRATSKVTDEVKLTPIAVEPLDLLEPNKNERVTHVDWMGSDWIKLFPASSGVAELAQCIVSEPRDTLIVQTATIPGQVLFLGYMLGRLQQTMNAVKWQFQPALPLRRDGARLGPMRLLKAATPPDGPVAFFSETDPFRMQVINALPSLFDPTQLRRIHVTSHAGEVQKRLPIDIPFTGGGPNSDIPTLAVRDASIVGIADVLENLSPRLIVVPGDKRASLGVFEYWVRQLLGQEQLPALAFHHLYATSYSEGALENQTVHSTGPVRPDEFHSLDDLVSP